MVRQNYLHRLALGRSAFEAPVWLQGERPSDDLSLVGQRDGAVDGDDSSGEHVQQYNSRGHPQNLASRARVRRTIRAHNEVLATVDVCARVDSAGREFGKLGSKVSELDHNTVIIEENETGLWIGFADDLLCLIATTFTANLRRRIETFAFYAGLPLLTVARIELSRLGIFDFFLAGEIANTVFYILDTSLDTIIEIGRDSLLNRFSASNTTDGERLRNKKLIYIAERGLKTISFCALFPLQLYAALQRLNLLPAWPILPNPFRLSYFLPIIPPPLPSWNSRSMGAFTVSLLTSPVVSYLAMYHFTDLLKIKLSTYARATITRPDNPDRSSYKLGIGRDEDASGAAPVLDYPKYQGSLYQELHKDAQCIIERLTDIQQRVRNNLRWLFNRKRLVVDFPDLAPQHSPGTNHHSQPSSAFQSSGLQNRPESQDHRETLSILVTAGSSTATPTSPLLTPTSSEEPELPVGEQSNVRIRTRTGSTSTLHMDVEFNAPERGGPIVTSSFAASPRPAIVEALLTPATHHPHYRVTALTLHPSDAFGSHLIGALVSLIRLPLESYYIRCLAHNFIATELPNAANIWMLSHVYPLRNWFGIGFHRTGWFGPADYASKVLLCIGIEAFVTAEVWRLGCWAAWWVGRRWYSWGKL